MTTLLYVSPHLDDAVLSAGGSIAAQAGQGENVIVATVVTADPGRSAPRSALAHRYWTAWGRPDTPFADRCEEDRAAVGHLGATPVHLGLLDCTYRWSPTGRTLYDSMESLFSGAPDPEDGAFIDAVAVHVGGLIDRLQPGRIYAPLTVGRHVDHVCVTRAVHQEARRRHLPLYLWEDLPYASGIYPPDDPDTVHAALARNGWEHLSPVFERIDVEPKIEATLYYVSQIDDLFASPGAARKVLNDYACSLAPGRSVERFWIHPPGTDRSR